MNRLSRLYRSILCMLLTACAGDTHPSLQPDSRCITFILNGENITLTAQKYFIIRAVPALQAASEKSDAVYRLHKYQGSGERVSYFLIDDNICFNKIHSFKLMKYKIFTSIFIFDKKENNTSGFYEYEYYGSFYEIPNIVYLEKWKKEESIDSNKPTLYFDEKLLFNR